MPQTINIGAFVLGAVLLLIAILRGGFKIFGAEVSGETVKFGRPISGIAGVMLICIGLFGSFDKSRTNRQTNTIDNSSGKSLPNASQPADSTAKDQQRVNPVQSTNAAQEAVAQPAAPVDDAPVDLAGTWHDSLGTVYQVSQQGSNYTFRATGSNFYSEGRGTVRGRTVESTYQTVYANYSRSSGRCTGTITDNGNQVQSSCVDSVNGPWQTVTTR